MRSGRTVTQDKSNSGAARGLAINPAAASAPPHPALTRHRLHHNSRRDPRQSVRTQVTNRGRVGGSHVLFFGSRGQLCNSARLGIDHSHQVKTGPVTPKRYDTIQSGTIQNIAIQYSMIWYKMVHVDHVKDFFSVMTEKNSFFHTNSIQYNMIQCNIRYRLRYSPETKRHKTITYNTIRYDVAWYDTVQCWNDTIWYMIWSAKCLIFFFPVDFN